MYLGNEFSVDESCMETKFIYSSVGTLLALYLETKGILLLHTRA